MSFKYWFGLVCFDQHWFSQSIRGRENLECLSNSSFDFYWLHEWTHSNSIGNRPTPQFFLPLQFWKPMGFWDKNRPGESRGTPSLFIYPSSSSSSSSYLSLSPLSWVQSSVIVQLPSWPDVSLTGLRSDASLWIFWAYYFYLYRLDIVVDRQTPPSTPPEAHSL